MTKPLALVVYEKLLPGSQIVNRLEDMGYRTAVIADAGKLVDEVKVSKPMIVFADLYSEKADVCAAIQAVKANEETSYVPVLAINPNDTEELRIAAIECGANLVVGDEAILLHLNEFLNQALEI